MASAEEMKAYTESLRHHTPSLDIPLTEIVVFKLIEHPTEETTALIERDFVGAATGGEGIRRIGWGYSLDDPRTFIIMFDWRKIQDHWDFWQTPAFGPVIACITKCFEPGRPLVRHYKFDPPGMLKEEFVQVLVWDEGAERSADEIARKVESKSNSWVSRKAGFAMDLGEMTWCSVLLGYRTEAAARADEIGQKGETHLAKLKYNDNI